MEFVLIAIVLALILCTLITAIIFNPGWQNIGVYRKNLPELNDPLTKALEKYAACSEKAAWWWNLPKEEWQGSFKEAETKIIFEEAMAAYQELAEHYPKHVIEAMKAEQEMHTLGKSWCEFIRELENLRVGLSEADQKNQEAPRRECGDTIGVAIQMSEAIGKKYPQIRFDWYREILMEYYYIIAEDRLPPDEKDIN